MKNMKKGLSFLLVLMFIHIQTAERLDLTNKD